MISLRSGFTRQRTLRCGGSPWYRLCKISARGLCKTGQIEKSEHC
jgi:hypothetical protein